MADIREERFEVFLEVGVLVSDDVAPLDHHVIESYIGIVQGGLFVCRKAVIIVPQQ